ncbi:MAG: glutamate--tRNA ligase [Anaerolineaceae bacterium]|nr:glutamate--tRNA ligase [Anaerolineaceae bacterium]
MIEKPARVRFAPSPTGRMHLGSARTALYDYLIAQQTGGQFILRIEDTDRKRYVPGSEEELIEGLKWLGLKWDEGPDIGGPYGPYRQSERVEVYKKYIQELIDNDHAFYCFCSPESLQKVRQAQQKAKETFRYDGKCRAINKQDAAERVANGEKYVVRFKTPKEGFTEVTDHVRGVIRVENKTLDDYILVKSDGLPLYHLAAMVDDHLMKITHVIRGSEWLPTFPLHGLIYRAFGWEEPVWVHLSVFLKPSGKGKMSKREAVDLKKGGHSIFVKDMQEFGYLPEGLVNWTVLMGWSLDGMTEYFDMEDLIEKFSIQRLNPSPAAINFSKLDHFNGLHIRKLEKEDLAKRLLPYFSDYEIDMEKLLKVVPLIQERLVTLDDAPKMAGFFFQDQVVPVVEELIAKKMTAEESMIVAEKAFAILQNAVDMQVETIEQPLRDLVEELTLKPGQVFGIIRTAVTGQKVSPPLFESMEIIGKEKVIERMKTAIQLLKNFKIH